MIRLLPLISLQETMVSGIYPPLLPPSAPQTRTFSEREIEGVELWRDMLTEGGANVILNDRIDGIRYMKVSRLSSSCSELTFAFFTISPLVLDIPVASLASQNVINCAWSSIQGLIRTVPASFEPLPPSLHEAVKPLFREIVDTGFRSGLLRQGMVQYPGGKSMGDAAEVAKQAWDFVRLHSVE